MVIDPTYPLFPVLSLICPALLFIVLATSFVRRSGNIGLWVLCSVLSFETLSYGINHILWSNNTDIKHLWFCDIVSRFQVLDCVAKPACSFVITRRLYRVASMHSAIANSDNRQKYIDLAIEVGVAIILPLFVMAVPYTLVQPARFHVTEGFGCSFAASADLVTVLVVISWPVILPLISIIIFCPRVLVVFYRQGYLMKQVRKDDQAGTSINPHLRVLALGSLDIVFTLPFGVLNLVQVVRSGLVNGGPFPLYIGRTAPSQVTTTSYSSLQAQGPLAMFLTYFLDWSSVAFALAVFVLFGFADEACTTYKKWMHSAVSWVLPESMRWSVPVVKPQLSEIRFGTPHLSGDSSDESSNSIHIISGVVDRCTKEV